METHTKGKRAAINSGSVSDQSRSAATRHKKHASDGSQPASSDIKRVLKELTKMRKLIETGQKKKVGLPGKGGTSGSSDACAPHRPASGKRHVKILTQTSFRPDVAGLQSFSSSVNASTVPSVKGAVGYSFFERPGPLRSFQTGPQPTPTVSSFTRADTSSNYNSLKVWLDKTTVPTSPVLKVKHKRRRKVGPSEQPAKVRLRRCATGRRKLGSVVTLIQPGKPFEMYSPRPAWGSLMYGQPIPATTPNGDLIKIYGEDPTQRLAMVPPPGKTRSRVRPVRLLKHNRTALIPFLSFDVRTPDPERPIPEPQPNNASVTVERIEVPQGDIYSALQGGRPTLPQRKQREQEHEAARRIQNAFRARRQKATAKAPKQKRSMKNCTGKQKERVVINPAKPMIINSKTVKREKSVPRSKERKKSLAENIAAIESMLRNKLALQERRQKQRKISSGTVNCFTSRASNASSLKGAETGRNLTIIQLQKERESQTVASVPESRKLSVHPSTANLPLRPRLERTDTGTITVGLPKRDNTVAQLVSQCVQTSGDNSPVVAPATATKEETPPIMLNLNTIPNLESGPTLLLTACNPPKRTITTRSEDVCGGRREPETKSILKNKSGCNSKDGTYKHSDTGSKRVVDFRLEDEAVTERNATEQSRKKEDDDTPAPEKLPTECAEEANGTASELCRYSDQASENVEGSPITIMFTRKSEVIMWTFYFLDGESRDEEVEQGEEEEPRKEKEDGAIDTEIVAFTMSKRDVVACRSISFEKMALQETKPGQEISNWAHVSVLIPTCLDIFRNLSKTALEYGLSLWEEDPDPTAEEALDKSREAAIEQFLKRAWIQHAQQSEVNIESVVKALTTLESAYPRASAQVDALSNVSEYATWNLVQRLKNCKERRLGTENAIELFSKDIVEECLREISHLFVLYRDLNGKKLKLAKCSMLDQFPTTWQRTEYAKLLSTVQSPILGNPRRPPTELEPELHLNLNTSALTGNGEFRGATTERAQNLKLMYTGDMHTTKNVVGSSMLPGRIDSEDSGDDDDEEDYKNILEPMQQMEEKAELQQVRRQTTPLLQATQTTVVTGEALALELDRAKQAASEFANYRYFRYPFGKEYAFFATPAIERSWNRAWSASPGGTSWSHFRWRWSPRSRSRRRSTISRGQTSSAPSNVRPAGTRTWVRKRPQDFRPSSAPRNGRRKTRPSFRRLVPGRSSPKR